MIYANSTMTKQNDPQYQYAIRSDLLRMGFMIILLVAIMAAIYMLERRLQIVERFIVLPPQPVVSTAVLPSDVASQE